MKYVLEVVYDDSYQECTNSECSWKGGPYEEPWTNCPLCFHRLEVIGDFYSCPPFNY